MQIPYPRRVGISLASGAALGVLCIIGVGSRIGFTGNESYLIGMWYNRVVMGLLIGLSSEIIIISDDEMKNAAIRGLLLGFFVTTAILLSTSFKDYPSYLAGLAYGIIIDVVATKYSRIEPE